MSWQDQILRDIDINTAESVVESIITTSKYMDDRNYPAEAIAMLKWHGYAFWALPRGLTADRELLRLVNGVYFRSWFCVLDGVKIDGHIYVNSGSGCCQVCGS